MINLRKIVVAGAATAALALSAASAQASQTFYNTQSSFLTAAGTVATEDFADTTLLPGLTITSTVGNIGGGVFNDQVAPGQTTEFDLGHSSTAWGAFFDETVNGFGSGIAFTITLMNSSTVVLSQELGGAAGDFFGFTSTDAFNKVLLSQGSGPGIETYSMDNMQYNGVPEASTWALMLVGFGGLGAAMRANRRRAAIAA